MNTKTSLARIRVEIGQARRYLEEPIGRAPCSKRDLNSAELETLDQCLPEIGEAAE